VGFLKRVWAMPRRLETDVIKGIKAAAEFLALNADFRGELRAAEQRPDPRIEEERRRIELHRQQLQIQELEVIKTDATAEELADVNAILEADVFFSQLDQSKLCAEEQNLYCQLIAFLDEEGSNGRADLSSACANDKVKAALGTFVPATRNRHMSLRTWINRRIGSVLDTETEAGQIYFKLREAEGGGPVVPRGRVPTAPSKRPSVLDQKPDTEPLTDYDDYPIISRLLPCMHSWSKEYLGAMLQNAPPTCGECQQEIVAYHTGCFWVHEYAKFCGRGSTYTPVLQLHDPVECGASPQQTLPATRQHGGEAPRSK